MLDGNAHVWTVAEYELEFLRLLQYGSSLVPTEADRCQKFREVERVKGAEEVLLRQTDRLEREWPKRPSGHSDSSPHPGKRAQVSIPQRSSTRPRPTVQQTPAVSKGDSSGFTPLPPCEYCGRGNKAQTSAQTPARSQTTFQTPARGRTQSRASGYTSRTEVHGHPQQRRGPALSEARQPALVYATHRRDDQDEPDVIADSR
ncbi:hypothetical protein V6N12_050717 [Hibiscus sabdariffa]|uniref:Uncharacterized protein n=1 Tax=Hibiscus sabdariffa TaxID=183260 RepID=A0ABR2GD76_9ROSI